MPVRVITLPFDSIHGLFDDEILTNFLLNKQLKSLKPAFFQHDGKPYWTVLVEYEPLLAVDEKRPAGHLLTTEQTSLLGRLRQWRREKADRDGVPAFVIATNKQLEQLTLRLPKSLESLRQINGFGKSKVERHGKEIIELIRAFHPDPTPASGEANLPLQEEPIPEAPAPPPPADVPF